MSIFCNTKNANSYNYIVGKGVGMIATQGALHPGFNTFDNDIGLLFMPRNIPFMGKKLQNNHLLFQYECISQPDCEVVRTNENMLGNARGNASF